MVWFALTRTMFGQGFVNLDFEQATIAPTPVGQFGGMREINGVLSATKGLTQADLDVLFDANANTIGALMLHLAATETYDGLHTFDGLKWGSWSDEVKKKWDAAMELGDAGRKAIKGNKLDYYAGILHDVREHTLAQFRKKDDAWLMAVDNDWAWGPTNSLTLFSGAIANYADPSAFAVDIVGSAWSVRSLL